MHEAGMPVRRSVASESAGRAGATRRPGSPPSRDAELVALGVLHDGVPEDVAVPFLANHRRAGGDQLGDFLPDQSGALDHVPGAWTRHPDIDMQAILAGLALGYLQEADGGAHAIRVNYGRLVGLVETEFLDVAESPRPESCDPLRIVRIAPQGPESRHGANVRDLRPAVIGSAVRLSDVDRWPRGTCCRRRS